MQWNLTSKTLFGMLVLAFTLPFGTLHPQDNIPNFAGTWWELNIAPDKAMKLHIVQSANELNEDFLGRLTIHEGMAFGKIAQPYAPPFRKLGYDYDANPSYSTITLGLKGKTLVFTEDTHWVTPGDGHPIGIEHERHLLQRYPIAPANGNDGDSQMR